MFYHLDSPEMECSHCARASPYRIYSFKKRLHPDSVTVSLFTSPRIVILLLQPSRTARVTPKTLDTYKPVFAPGDFYLFWIDANNICWPEVNLLFIDPLSKEERRGLAVQNELYLLSLQVWRGIKRASLLWQSWYIFEFRSLIIENCWNSIWFKDLRIYNFFR